MCSGVIVSRATIAVPGSFTEGVLLPPFAPLAPPATAPPSAHTSKLAHTIRHADAIFSIPRIYMLFLPPRGARLESFFFVKVCKDCNGGPAPGSMRSVESAARECNHRWNSGHSRTCPAAQIYAEKGLCGDGRPRPSAE